MSQSRFSLKLRLPFFARASAKQERRRRASSSEAERENAATAASEASEGRSAQKTDDSDDRSVCPLCKNPLAVASGASSSSKKKLSGVCRCRKSSGRNFFRRDPRRHSHAGTSEADSLRNKLGKTSAATGLDYFDDEADLFDGIVRCPDETSDVDVDAAASSLSSSSTSNGRRPEVAVRCRCCKTYFFLWR